MEDYQDEAGGVQLACQTASFKYGLWVNTSKNPRLKTVEFPQLGFTFEVAALTTKHSNRVRTYSNLTIVSML